MDIVEAGPQHLNRILEMCLRFGKLTDYAKYIEPRQIGKVVASHLMDDNKVILINKEQTGMIFGLTAPLIWGPAKTAIEMLWWVEPEERNRKLGKELVLAFENWAKKQGCELITLACLDDRVARMYKKAGFKLYERTYYKEI